MTEEQRPEKGHRFAQELGALAGEDRQFMESFIQKIKQDEEVLEEFVYYAENNQFADKVKVNGYSVIDVLIWQIDHFKAWLDRDNTKTKENGSAMLLHAFDTFLNMRKAPEKYIRAMESETGTDYPEKF